jgi:hypothetical protein
VRAARSVGRRHCWRVRWKAVHDSRRGVEQPERHGPVGRPIIGHDAQGRDLGVVATASDTNCLHPDRSGTGQHKVDRPRSGNRARREAYGRTADGNVDVSVSGGCASSMGDSAEDLIHLADSCLYRAKESGRNKIITASLPTTT